MKKKFMFVTLTLILVFSCTAVFANDTVEKVAYEVNDLKDIEQQQRMELRAIWNKYNVSSKSPAIPSSMTRRPDPGYTGIGSKGDILIALDSITDHVAIVKDTYIVIEAHPKNPNGGVDYRDNNWTERYSRIKGMSVSGASSSEKTDAVDYAEGEIGDPYSLATTHWTTDQWYCSKLVWRAWYEQGYDIEGRKYEPRGSHVTPGDILDSPLTTVFYTS